MEYKEFINTIKSIATSDTSVDPDEWNSDNNLWGHCEVVSLLAQDFYGGELVRAPLEKHHGFANVCAHCWNRVDGVDVDFTEEQFSNIKHTDLTGEVRSRESLLSHSDTAYRYTLLKKRFEEVQATILHV